MAKDPIKTLELIEKRLDALLPKILNDIAWKIKRRIDSQEFIKWKSKKKPIVVEKARMVGDVWVVSVRTASRWKWGHVLVGPAGTTTIKAKKGKLAIPNKGTERYYRGMLLGPKNYSGTVIINNVIYGRAGWGGKGVSGWVRNRRAAGEKIAKETLVPLFFLKDQVVVRRRVIPADMQAWGGRLLREALIKKGLLKP